MKHLHREILKGAMSFSESRLCHKDPLPVGEILIRNGGSIKTEDGTVIISVSAAGLVTVAIEDITLTGDQVIGDASTDTLTVNATSTFNAPVTVGVNGTGYDVQFFGDTSGMYLLWDESADTLKLVGGAGFTQDAQSVTPNNDSGAASTINPGVTAVDVAAVTNDANDWIVLPSLSAVPVGHTIKIACNAGTNFEMRTPASSNEKINTVDSDGGSAEYLCTDTEMLTVTKVSDTDGWVATAQTALGAIATAVVPD